ncbi:MAG: hypothetical protein JKX80_00685 [Candidatus Pacebacteria bacterium]|nr:hypothetical protein [Candidatus Paceibacterota bacterium]
MAQPHFIILGAGASFDFISEKDMTADKRFKPPLAMNLLNPRLFHFIIKDYPEVSALTSSVQSALAKGKDLEEFMEELKSKGLNRKKQLVALQFYLQKLFQEISDNFGKQPGNNYYELINKIKDTEREACIVTFNYDSLLEGLIPRLIERQELRAYISDDIKIIKLHGSCEWSYFFRSMWDMESEEIRKIGIDRHLIENPELLFGLGTDQKQPEVIPKRSYKDRDNGFSYPALAIPLREKHDFVCPTSHVEIMKESLRKTGKILLIGWKAADQNLLDIFTEEIKHPIEFTIVAGSKESGKEVEKELKEVLKVNCTFRIFDGGFSQFLSHNDSDVFFQG